MAAQSVIRSDSALGAFYRRMKARIDPQQALVATAHKIARIVYVMLRDRRHFQDVGARAYEEQFRQRELKYLQRKAAKLGFILEPTPA